ncbi:2-dehydro-3-deoxygluconokinase [Actinoplanes lutulentus]|uniref:2-dehydro-3-deoxygluconokinase n=1 Tax=Actinoplanes lutulentus TaxID=1287878 RepID=A0A327ZBH0_9ACTN|nr:sugar kinase [Actinoplanes lutulentus]MBB2947305.1 2-dehydro-3-deoxygluconokinase [Actinoplanes lutulentus]RAK36580.1 2-dehydro-3-deoxygluconokinase [Actinoplanes lutulentus]
MPDLVTLGEAMLVVRGCVPGRLGPGSPAVLSFAGAEATVAIGASRLGHTATWIGRLGADTGGDLVLEGLRGAGVDITAVTRDQARATGLLMRHQRTTDRVVVDYYRDGLAGSRLTPEQLPDGVIESARILHVTGITPALSASAADAVHEAILRARSAGVTVSFDVNYRSRLWSPERAGPQLRALAEKADLIFAGVDEAALITGVRDDLGSALRKLGPGEAVIKNGAAGATVVTADAMFETAAVPVTQADPIGAGDAFVAGYLSGVLDGLDPRARLHQAAVCGAFAASTVGDWEGLATRAELLSFSDDDVRR